MHTETCTLVCVYPDCAVCIALSIKLLPLHLPNHAMEGSPLHRLVCACCAAVMTEHLLSQVHLNAERHITVIHACWNPQFVLYE